MFEFIKNNYQTGLAALVILGSGAGMFVYGRSEVGYKTKTVEIQYGVPNLENYDFVRKVQKDGTVIFETLDDHNQYQIVSCAPGENPIIISGERREFDENGKEVDINSAWFIKEIEPCVEFNGNKNIIMVNPSDKKVRVNKK